MKAALQVVAALIGIAVFYTAWFLLWFVASGRIGMLVHTGALGMFTLVGWAVTLLVGPYAAIQLWRLRRGGWVAAVLLLACSQTYYLVGLASFRSPAAPVGPLVVMAATNMVILVTLISKRARELCGVSVRPN